MGTVTIPPSPSQRSYLSRKLLLENEFAIGTNFPSTFQNFFAKLSEPVDDNDENSVGLLENKQLLQSKLKGNESTGYRRRLPDRHWSMNRRSLRKKHEPHTEAYTATKETATQQVSVSGHMLSSISVSPIISRRRSSIAVPRVPLDLNRFLQSEQTKQWLQMSQSPSSIESVHTQSTTLMKPLSPRPKSHSPIPLENPSYSRNRTASVPAVPSRHRPMLSHIKKSDPGVEYYRLRSFSITPNGIFNLGDSFKSRSRSISSVNSTESSQTDASGHNKDQSAMSQCSSGPFEKNNQVPPTYRVAVLGASGVGKTTLTHQFTTSEYTCAYDTSLDDEFGQKTVSVMVDGKETELEIIDHPASEISIETFCSTYNPDVYVIVYSVDDRGSMKTAEEMVMYLWKSDYMSSHGVILVGNKADLERKREIPTSAGRKLANGCGCKFIETSSGLDHNVDELLVGILAQVHLNPRRKRNQFTKKKVGLESGRRLFKHLLGIKRKSKSCENLFIL